MRPLFILIFLFLPLAAAADSPAPAPAHRSGVCETPSLFVQCGVKGSPCCIGSRFYFDPRAHQLPAALGILVRIADRDPDEARRQLSRLRDIGRLRSAEPLRSYPKLAALYATLP